MIRRLPVLVAALAAMAVPAPVAGAAAGPVPPDFFGLVSEDTFAGTPDYRAGQLAAQRAHGIRLLRQPFIWQRIETAPGRYDFTEIDRFVLDAAANGIAVMPVLFGEVAGHSSRPPGGTRRGTYPPRDFKAFAEFAAAVARRYGPGGTLWLEHPLAPAVPMRSYQVWNEPNLPVYWLPRPSAKSYAKLLKATHGAIRFHQPDAEIVTAGLPASRLGVPLERYLRDLYRNGAKQWFEALGLNPYSNSTAEMVARLRRVRRIARQYKDPHVRFWITELGWSTQGPSSRFRVGTKRQSALLRDAVRTLRSMRRSLGIRGLVYFSWRDAPVYPGGKDFWGLHTGLHDINGKPKPALLTLRQAVGAPR